MSSTIFFFLISSTYICGEEPKLVFGYGTRRSTFRKFKNFKNTIIKIILKDLIILYSFENRSEEFSNPKKLFTRVIPRKF